MPHKISVEAQPNGDFHLEKVIDLPFGGKLELILIGTQNQINLLVSAFGFKQKSRSKKHSLQLQK